MVDRMMSEIAEDVRADTSASLATALAAADVVFTHESFSAESALDLRRPGQQVWMMCHGVTPMSLYTAWSWAVPEADWRSLREFPDVRTWTDWELGVWKRLDGLVLPCAEAGDSFRQIDSRFNEVLDRARFVLSGAAAAGSGGAAAATSSGADLLGPRNDRRVGLYLGSPEPYRGFDALIAGVQALPAGSNLTIAVAGPDRSKVPVHPAIRALGRVEDVGALLASVDFLINVNRFSLFDLSTIEAAQAGKPLMLHAVGGNRAFERIGAGCVMLEDLEPPTIAECLTDIAAFSAATLVTLGQQSRACWETQLTPRHMWERHLALYDELSRGG
jgi:glycosyltransferase involved in cell wall biosynthesis